MDTKKINAKKAREKMNALVRLDVDDQVQAVSELSTPVLLALANLKIENKPRPLKKKSGELALRRTFLVCSLLTLFLVSMYHQRRRKMNTLKTRRRVPNSPSSTRQSKSKSATFQGSTTNEFPFISKDPMLQFLTTCLSKMSSPREKSL